MVDGEHIGIGGGEDPRPSATSGRLAALARLQRDVARQSLDVERAMRTVVDRLPALFRAGGAAIVLRDGAAMEYHATSGRLLERCVGLRLDVHHSLSGLTVRTGRTLLCGDAQQDARVAQETARRLGIASMVITPLATSGRVIGAIKVVSARRHAFDATDVEALALVSDVLAAALDNAATVHAREDDLRAALDAQEKTTRELRMLSEALEHSMNGFDIVDARGNLRYANAAYLRMWGYDTLDEVLGTPAAAHCLDPEVPARILDALRTRGECTIEFVGLRKDKSTFDVRMWARRARDADGAEIYPTTSIDVTERNKHEVALREAIRTRDEFLSLASHELKTPLTTLRLQTELRARHLAAGDDARFNPQALAGMFESDARQIRRLTRLIDDMLDIGRLNTGKLSLHPERFDLGELAEEVIERLRPQLERERTTVELVRHGPVVGTWDRFRLEQAFTNLLTNGMKYGAGRPIVVEVSRTDDEASLVVRDEGIGIRPEDQERIFQLFERASTGLAGGLGLGLFIVREVTRMHGGSVAVDSDQGRGATFTVRLPL